jgi:hypothetical protein
MYTERMPTIIQRTVTASELRDPDVLAEAGRGPIGVYDSRRQDSLVLTSRAAYERDQQLQRYLGLLAHAVVELSREDPSPAALGEVGYVATWLPPDRAWWLRGFAEATAAGVTSGSAEPIVGFITAAKSADSARVPSPLEEPIDAKLFDKKSAAKLKPRRETGPHKTTR